MIAKSILTRRVAEVIVEESLKSKLASGKKLRVKFGIDPTSPDIHIGHGIPIMKLRELQKVGHQIVLIIGDFTARIGDPSGKNETRKALTPKEVEKNAKTYLDQIGKLIDIKQAEVHNNSEWLGEMKPADFIKLLSQATLGQMMAHETFRKRAEDQETGLALHELLYPIMQGYDSVMVKADLEVGGIDQKFNLLMGRELQKAYLLPPQDIMTMDYLFGLDGKEKMSKSLGNYIAIGDAPTDMYGKVMSIPDTLIVQYAQLATDLTDNEITKLKSELKSGANPKLSKMQVASALVELYHGRSASESAAVEFEKVFKSGELPSEMKNVSLHPRSIKAFELLVAAELASSNSEARRLVEQGGATLNGKKFTDPNELIKPAEGDIVRIGKRKTAKVELRHE